MKIQDYATFMLALSLFQGMPKIIKCWKFQELTVQHRINESIRCRVALRRVPALNNKLLISKSVLILLPFQLSLYFVTIVPTYYNLHIYVLLRIMTHLYCQNGTSEKYIISPISNDTVFMDPVFTLASILVGPTCKECFAI